jgi:hypothetical protein
MVAEKVTISNISSQLDCSYKQCLELLIELNIPVENNRVALDQQLMDKLIKRLNQSTK